TDGQQTKGGLNPIQAAKFAKKNNIKIYTIAIVNNSSSSRSFGLGRFLNFQRKSIDTKMLQKVASMTGGIFAKADSGKMLATIYQKIAQLEKSKIQKSYITYKESFQLWLFIGLGILFLEIILTQSIFRKAP
ncbi:MAG: Ca-activated chloride channel family protein, partial [bacterium]